MALSFRTVTYFYLQNNITNLPHRNFIMLKLQAVFHFCIQIDEANVIECYIHFCYCWDYVFGPYLVMNYSVFFLVLQSS